MLTNKLFLGLVLILSPAGLLVGRGATVAKAQPAPGRAVTGQTSRDLWDTQTAGNLTLRRASRLIGKSLKNTQGETLGTIDDLVLTPNFNEVSYAVLARGGLFGLGRRQYAIPWSAMRAGLGDTLIAPIDKQELKQDPGFRNNLWPTEGDPRWLGRAGQRTEQVTFDVQPPVAQKDIRRRRVTRLLGTPVRDPQDDGVGRVQDMLVAVNTGDIPFTIVGYGGMLGLGNKYTAVPAGAMEFRPGDSVAHVKVSEQILRANAFDPSNFPDLSDPAYAQRIYTAYDIRPQDPDWVVLGYVPPEAPDQSQRITPYQLPMGTPARPQGTLPVQPQGTQPPDQTPLAQGQQVPQFNGTARARSEYLAAFPPDNLRTIEGVVTGVSTFQQVGTNAEWVQLQVRTDDGGLATVHLGPRDYVSRQDFYVASNDRIILMGAQATAWRQPIILPITASVSGRTITLRDRTGRPLWDQMVEPQQDLSQPTQPAPTQPDQPGSTQPDASQPAQQGATQPIP